MTPLCNVTMMFYMGVVRTSINQDITESAIRKFNYFVMSH